MTACQLIGVVLRQSFAAPAKRNLIWMKRYHQNLSVREKMLMLVQYILLFYTEFLILRLRWRRGNEISSKSAAIYAARL